MKLIKYNMVNKLNFKGSYYKVIIHNVQLNDKRGVNFAGRWPKNEIVYVPEQLLESR